MRRFMLKKNSRPTNIKWLNRKTVYEGKLLSMSRRVVRLYAPDPADPRAHVDLSYDWVIPMRDPHVAVPVAGPEIAAS